MKKNWLKSAGVCVLLVVITIGLSACERVPASEPELSASPAVVDLGKSSVFLIDAEDIHDKHGDVYRTARGLWGGLTANFIEYRTGPHKSKTFNLYHEFENYPRREDRYIIIDGERFYLHRRQPIPIFIEGGSEGYDRDGNGFHWITKYSYVTPTTGIVYDFGPHRGEFFPVRHDQGNINSPWQERVKYEYIVVDGRKYYLYSYMDNNGDLYVDYSTPSDGTVKGYRKYLTGPQKDNSLPVYFDDDERAYYIIVDGQKEYLPRLIDKNDDSYIYLPRVKIEGIWIDTIRYSTGPHAGKEFEVYYDNYYSETEGYIRIDGRKFYPYRPPPADPDRG
ncbi:hypothetical protein C6502_11280 [Candidatus Poribacteria bacterium]|nr:MAG: hypothetical protein C6502_11280 [Candidatus Poribacteria bacterium]